MKNEVLLKISSLELFKIVESELLEKLELILSAMRNKAVENIRLERENILLEKGLDEFSAAQNATIYIQKLEKNTIELVIDNSIHSEKFKDFFKKRFSELEIDQIKEVILNEQRVTSSYASLIQEKKLKFEEVFLKKLEIMFLGYYDNMYKQKAASFFEYIKNQDISTKAFFSCIDFFFKNPSKDCTDLGKFLELAKRKNENLKSKLQIFLRFKSIVNI